MRIFAFSAFLLTFVLATAYHAGAENIPEPPVALLGLDPAGKPLTRSVPASAFTKGLTLAFGTVDTSLLPVLAARTEPARTPAWRLRTLGAGVGLSGSFGLGPLFSVTVSPKLRLVYTNSKNPVFPD